MELVTSSVSGTIRRERLNGRDYIVAPVRMVVPGVLNGSAGRLLYPPEELASNPMAWNHMPIVIDHPKDSTGKAISARSAKVLNESGLGFLFESKYGEALDAEGWFDDLLTKRKSPQIYNSLLNGEPIELSTGLFTKNQTLAGVYNGQEYDAIARQHVPDHLAILPNKKGACSNDRGCGVNMGRVGKALGVLNSFFGHSGRPGSVGGSSSKEEGRKLSKAAHDATDKAYKLGTSAAHKEAAEAHALLSFHSGVSQFAAGRHISLADKHKKLSAHLAKSEPKTNEQDDHSGSSVFNVGESDMSKLTEDQRKSIVEKLVTNCDCEGHGAFTENEREGLSKLTDDRLTELDNYRKRVSNAEKVAKAAKAGFEHGNDKLVYNEEKGEFVKTAKETPVTNAEGKTESQLEQEFLDKMPARFRTILQNAENVTKNQHGQLVEKILKLDPESFTKNELADMTVNQLEKFVKVLEKSKTPTNNGNDQRRRTNNQHGSSGGDGQRFTDYAAAGGSGRTSRGDASGMGDKFSFELNDAETDVLPLPKSDWGKVNNEEDVEAETKAGKTAAAAKS